MHLTEILSLRSSPAAGVTMGLTRRCPLSCEHCSTSSTMTSEHHQGGIFARFVDTFSPECHPEVLAMSGGEALLRPDLVRDLALRARQDGTRSTVLSGMFFATLHRIPPEIRAAIAAVDHFAVSIDVFHERQVPRVDVFRAMESLLDDGKDISVHIVGQDALDPYIEDIVADVQRVFAGRVPMLVNVVAAFGRARNWLRRSAPTVDVGADPCSMAAWPVVGYDGAVYACGNDDARDRGPAHLRLGHVDTDDWATIRARTLESRMVRAIRLFGPGYLADRLSDGDLRCDGYCATCLKLSSVPRIAERVRSLMTRPSTAILEAEFSALQRRAGAFAYARHHALPRYAELALLGAPT